MTAPDSASGKPAVIPAGLLRLRMIRQSFDKFDADGGGTVDKEELRDAMEYMGVSMSKDHFDKLWNSVDVDGAEQVRMHSMH